jgi:hypothetical protein
VAPELGAAFVPFYPPEEDKVPVEPVRDAVDRLADEATALTEGDIDAEAVWRVAVGLAQLADLLEGQAAAA